MQTQTILDRINTLPRIKLARLNTPFEEMPRLRAAIADSMDTDPNANKCAVPRLFIKRDDTTGFAFGGNKARHMEFLFAHLIDRGIDTIVNINHYDSNNARLVSAACAKTGIKCHWVAFDMLDKPITGNLLLGHLAGAVIHRVPAEHSRSVAENLLANSPSPARGGGFSWWGPNTPLRMWGLCGRSIAGIRLYARNTVKPWAASATAQQHHAPDTYQATYIERSTRVAKLLNLDTALVPGDIDTITGYAGRYGVPTEAALEAMHIVAKTEGIILDPNYTGKSMSALIGEIRAGNLDSEVPVVFIHSGGLPQTFAFAEEWWEWRRKER